jgi:hypothetical protein
MLIRQHLAAQHIRYTFAASSGSMELGKDGANSTRSIANCRFWRHPQPNCPALEYWAEGLKPIYLEGAIARAQGRLL